MSNLHSIIKGYELNSLIKSQLNFLEKSINLKLTENVKEALSDDLKTFGISKVYKSEQGEKFSIFLDDKGRLQPYMKQSKALLKNQMKTFVHPSEQKEYLTSIKDGMQYYVINDKKFLYHDELNTFIAIGNKELNFTKKKENFISNIIGKLRGTRQKFELQFNEKSPEIFLPSEKPQLVELTRENFDIVIHQINKNPNLILDLRNPPIDLIISKYENLNQQSKKELIDRFPNIKEELDFFKKHNLNKILSQNEVKEIYTGKLSPEIEIKIGEKKVKGKIRFIKGANGFKVDFYEKKNRSLEENPIYIKLQSKQKKEMFKKGMVVPVLNKEKTEIKLYHFDRDLNDIIEIKKSDLNISSKILDQDPKNIHDFLMGKPQIIDLEIDGITRKNVEISIIGNEIKMGEQKINLIQTISKEKSLQEKTISLARNINLDIDTKLKIAVEQKIPIKNLYEEVNKMNNEAKNLNTEQIIKPEINTTNKSLKL